MLKAAVPSATATRNRTELRRATKRRHAARNGTAGWSGSVPAGRRASCFQSAVRLRTMVARPAPWITWIRRNSLKFRSRKANRSALTTMPTISMT